MSGVTDAAPAVEAAEGSCGTAGFRRRAEDRPFDGGESPGTRRAGRRSGAGATEITSLVIVKMTITG
ncbi:hypothetical protein [Streptomyces sp. RPT161]|uniref:hypothetical protein n=1 Tax=Streptomyces sp. RPT161 TaxID=3015993 RepID=UPI0022B8C4E7|nr:hypothetical protein [Streptomyces sp. RPT161]